MRTLFSSTRSTRSSRRLVAATAATATVALATIALLPGSSAQASAPLKWAVSDGSSMTRSSAATDFTKFGTGRFEVTFATDVTNCAYIASTAVSGSQAQTVFTAGGHLSGNGVYVETKNQGGGLSDAPFSLFVSCDDTGAPERHAVLDTTGSLARGSAGTTVTKVGTGQYKVRFNRAVDTCSYLATVGDPANGLVFNPAGVSTASSSDPRAVYLETKNPGGGLSDSIPVHLAVICNDSHFTRLSVRANGTPARGSALTSSFQSAPGAYTIASPKNLTQCAWLTTRGETNTQVPFTPTTVEVAPGPANNTVSISEKSLLFFGGDPVSQAFTFVGAC